MWKDASNNRGNQAWELTTIVAAHRLCDSIRIGQCNSGGTNLGSKHSVLDETKLSFTR
jgi:hypothetical protein